MDWSNPINVLIYRQRAVELYNYERKVGWDPTWVNADNKTRNWYLEAAWKEEHDRG